MENNHDFRLTSAEMGKLWTTYSGNTMSKCILTHYLQHIEDQDIKEVLNDALNLCNSFLKTIEEIFIQEKFPIPIGFTEGDVDLNAPRLFLDEFYLHYLKYMGKAGMSIYSIAIPLMRRNDVKNFFIYCLQSTVKLLTEVDNVLMKKGFFVTPPEIPIPEKVDFVQKQKYLRGFFGDTRPLHALEITHLYDNLENDVTSGALLIAFSQVAKDDNVQQILKRGKNIADKHVEAFTEKLHKDDLPSRESLDHLVTDSTISPFSDKLMLIHKMEMFSMKVRTYANAASFNGRRDIGGMYTRFLMDNGLYVEDVTNILIDYGWLERPPQAVNRDNLSSK
ncbi:DUF3231 family protein [Virgibacillus ainsalahensis]